MDNHFTTIRDLQRNYKKVSKEVNKHNVPYIVMSKNKPQFVIISLEKLQELQEKKVHKRSIQSLLELADWAKKNKVHGPKDLSTNHDKYLWENNE